MQFTYFLRQISSVSRQKQIMMYYVFFSFGLAVSCMKAPLCHAESLFVMQLKFDLQ